MPTECGTTHEATSGMSSWDRPHPEVRPEGRETLPDKAGESTLLSHYPLMNSLYYKWDYALFEYQVVLMNKTRMRKSHFYRECTEPLNCQVFSVQQNLFPASPGKFRTFLWKWKCFSSHSYCIFLKPLFKEWIILKILLGVSSWHTKYNARQKTEWASFL